MNYFTLDMISRYNSPDKEIRAQAEKEWDQHEKAYWKEFDTYKNRLSKSFLRHYLLHGFHDYRLKKIELLRENSHNSNKEKTNVSIIISNFKNQTYQILFKSVTSVNLSFDISTDDEWEITFLYSEIFPIDDKLLSMEILFSNEGTIKVHSKNIIINTLNMNSLN